MLQTFVLLANVAKGNRVSLLVAMEMGSYELQQSYVNAFHPLCVGGGGRGGEDMMAQTPYTISLSTVTRDLIWNYECTQFMLLMLKA